MKTLGKLISIFALVLVLATGFLYAIETREAITDRARFIVIEDQKWIVPAPVSGRFFYPVQGSADAVFLRGKGATWNEIRKNSGPYSDFRLPPGPGWDQFVFYGQAQPLLWKLIAPRPSRWDDEGYWQY